MTTNLMISGVILMALAIYIFYAAIRSKNARRDHRHEHLKNRQEELLQILRAKANRDSNNENDKETSLPI